MYEKLIGLSVIIGYLIAVKQNHGLIAGWNESKVSNPAAYGKWIGYSVLTVGVCIGLLGLGWYLALLNNLQMTILLTISSVIPIPCLIIASFKYKKR